MMLWFVLWFIPTVEAFCFSSPVLPSQQQQRQQQHQHQYQGYRKNASFLHMTTSSTTKTPDLSSTDPFQILGIDPTADSQAIKRAYKKLAFQYHPDMVTTKDSTSEQKRMASDQFAKINAAYEALSGKTGRGNSSSGTRTNTNYNQPNAYTPPHRRTGTTSSSSSSSDWRDYIPYNTVEEDQKYDAGGDSFGAIFSDLFASASSRAAGSGGVVRDFIEFLEQTVDAYSSTSTSPSYNSKNDEEDAELLFLLQTGNIRQVGDEMDETELVLKQLNKKMERLDADLIELQADVAASSKFTQKMEMEETLEELRARKRVVDNYIQKARKRLLALQTRYKVLVVQGANDPKAGGTSRTTRADTTPSSPPFANSKNAEESWKDESFGSFGRGRGSSRRRAQRNPYVSTATTAPDSASSSPSSSTDTSNSSRNSSYEAPEPSRSKSSSAPGSSTYIPPHRRPQSSPAQDDKRRLREIKVDEEFEKLKRDLGL